MFRFTQTIIRELSACASLSYNVDFGYISLFEVIGIVAAYFVHSCCACGSCTVQIQSAQCMIQNCTKSMTEQNMQPQYR